MIYKSDGKPFSERGDERVRERERERALERFGMGTKMRRQLLVSPLEEG